MKTPLLAVCLAAALLLAACGGGGDGEGPAQQKPACTLDPKATTGTRCPGVI